MTEVKAFIYPAMKMLYLLAIASLLPLFEASPIAINVCHDPLHENEFLITEDDQCHSVVASLNYTNSVNATGWAVVEITTSAKATDEHQAYAAGLAEGFATSDLMKMQSYNSYYKYCEGSESYCEKLYAYLDQNLLWVKEQVAKPEAKKDPYWHLVKLMLIQLAGLQDGFEKKRTYQVNMNIDVRSVLMLQIQGELYDLEKVFNKPEHLRLRRPNRGSCSVMVKLYKNNIFFGDASWNQYDGMLRALKHYNFNYRFYDRKNNPKLVPGNRISMSSYPGYLYSFDDFYITSAGLVASETSIFNLNETLWKFVQPQGSVPEWIRVMVAIRLSASGAEWTKTFSRFNSGTYNNQWMVVDYKKIKDASVIPTSEVFFVLEQLPGYIHYQDLTAKLLDQKYFLSFDIPYFKSIYDLANTIENVKKFGKFWTYEYNPRSLIVQRDWHKVTSLSSLRTFLRYNDFKHDPISRCNCTPPYSASSAMSARADLNDPNGTYESPDYDFECFGGIDLKMTDVTMINDLQFAALAGPTRQGQPVFQWSKSPCDTKLRHAGHPDRWDFDPVTQKWNTPEL